MAQESQLEKWAKKEAEKRGWLSFKFVSPSQAGVPDRVFITPKRYYMSKWVRRASVVFVEFKAPGRKPTKLQDFWIEKLEDHGCVVRVVDSKEKMEEIFRWCHDAAA